MSEQERGAALEVLGIGYGSRAHRLKDPRAERRDGRWVYQGAWALCSTEGNPIWLDFFSDTNPERFTKIAACKKCARASAAPKALVVAESSQL